MKISTVKLGSICTFQSGGTPSKSIPEYWEGNIPWITTVALNGGYINEKDTGERITETALAKSAAKLVPAQSLMVGTRVGVGKVAINTVPMSTSQDVVSLIGIDEEKWYKPYLSRFLQGKSHDLQSQSRGATIKGIKIETLSELKVPLISLEKQIRISKLLETVETLIFTRKQQLTELDTLVKARFVEMFGEPVSNSKNWDTEKLSVICKAIYGGGTPSKSHPEYFDGNIPWVSPKDMKSAIITDSIDHITEEAIQNSTTKIVPSGAVLMVIRSGILKHTLPVAIAAVDLTVNQDMKAFIVGDRIASEFLMYYFKAIEADVLKAVRGVTADNIDFKEFQQRQIIVPPFSMQEQFAAFVIQVNQTKSVVQKALEEAQTLFDSLMQQYFG